MTRAASPVVLLVLDHQDLLISGPPLRTPALGTGPDTVTPSALVEFIGLRGVDLGQIGSETGNALRPSSWSWSPLAVPTRTTWPLLLRVSVGLR